MKIFVLALAMMSIGCSPMVYQHGIPNFDQVDASIYRGGQISSQEGWDYLKQIAGGRRVHIIKLNYNHEGSDALALAMGFDLLYVPIQPEGDQSLWDDFLSVWKTPAAMEIDRAETQLAYCKAHPDTDVCYGHCTHGQDRTGYVFGRHRVEHDGWTKARAYAEMLAHNFHPELHGIHEAWESYTPPVP